MVKNDYAIGSGAFTRAMLGEDAPKVDEKLSPVPQDDENSKPEIHTIRLVYRQDSRECQYFMPLTLPGEDTSIDRFQLVSLRTPGWEESPALECFATEYLALSKNGRRQPLHLRVYRFESRCDESAMKAIDVLQPARPYIEMAIGRPPALILANTLPEQYEQVTKDFAPGMRLLSEVSFKTRGGNRNDILIQELWSESNCKRFARLVDELAPKWKWIKSNDFDPSFSSPQKWVTEVRERAEFSALFNNCNRLTDDLLLQVTNNELSKRYRQPKALALIHAARELGIMDVYLKLDMSEPAVGTLSGYYQKGYHS